MQLRSTQDQSLMLLKLVHGKQSRTLALWYCRVGERALGLLLIMSAGIGRSTGDDSPWYRKWNGINRL